MTPQEIVDFWLNDVGPKGWYMGSAELDAQMRDKFLGLWWDIAAGGKQDWLQTAQGTFAYILVLDQFSRNIHRGAAQAFECDALARTASKMAIDKGFYKEIAEPERQFMFMPLVHSEVMKDQDLAVQMFETQMPLRGEFNLPSIYTHREEIRRFGRFPGRNQALGRVETQVETDYFAAGGYGSILKTFKK